MHAQLHGYATAGGLDAQAKILAAAAASDRTKNVGLRFLIDS
jgi:hypothetical protein